MSHIPTRALRNPVAADLIDTGIGLMLQGRHRFYGDVSGFFTRRYQLPASYTTKAEIALKRRDFSNALAATKTVQSLEEEPNGNAQMMKARVWKTLGDHDRAMDAYAAALRHNARCRGLSRRSLQPEAQLVGWLRDHLRDATLEKGDEAAAPAFTATALNGNSYDLTSLRGKVVVLNFWFVGRAPCRVEIPGLSELVEEFGDRDVVLRRVRPRRR